MKGGLIVKGTLVLLHVGVLQMARTIDMQDMRYLNLFAKITRVNTRYCLKYNEALIFCIPKKLISRAVGSAGKNVKQMSQILRKKIKIIEEPGEIENIKKFISDITDPVTFKGVEVIDDQVVLTAGSQSKAALLGRNKRRLKEMQKIVEDYFGKEFRIV